MERPFDSDGILLEKQGHVYTITLNRPDELNTISSQTIDLLNKVLSLAETDEQCRVLILAAKGRVFSAGGDLKKFDQSMDPVSAMDFSDKLNKLIIYLASFPKPTIAAVHAPVVGGGLGLVLAADIIAASDRASFSFVHRNMGLIPGGGCSYLLPRRVGLAKAKEIYFTGAKLNANEALTCGLVNMVVPTSEFTHEVYKLASRIATGPPGAMALGKALMDSSFDRDMVSALREESLALSHGILTRDHQEGVRAFMEKRKPVFTGK